MATPIATPPEQPPSEGQAAVYRLYDSSGALLYIGSTSDLARRWIDHKRERPWWSSVASYVTEWHADRAAAFDAEGPAIKQEKPLHNMLGTPAGAELARTSRATWIARRKAIGVFSDYANHPDGAVAAFARAVAEYEAGL